MKKCHTCGTIYSSSDTCCPACGQMPEMLEGFAAYAPDLAREGGGFKASYFADLADMEAEHFWFRARNRLIIWAIGKYCPEFRSLLEIGCGTGYVLSGIAKAYPEAELHGSEIFTAGLAFAANREPSIDFMQMDARHIPFIEEFDAIGAFDVLEHIEEDERVLMQMREALRLHGIMVLTVPQHAWLWSPVDEYACHVRRYSAKELHAKVEGAGFEILRSTSFVTTLLPAMWVSRFIKSHSEKGIEASEEAKFPRVLNRLFEMFLGAELALISMGVDFPLGGSRLVVARKS